MVRLTEDMVGARAKTSDMESVLKLNFWGSDLTDVSIVRQFRRAEILSFSLNQIRTMEDFAFCTCLVELCIRRNNIKDLREVCYLQDLPRLTKLLMTENPCCETAGELYRPTVLRALPNLEILDNVDVTATDREQARLYGLILEHPAQRKEKERAMPPGTRYYEGPDEIQIETLRDHRSTPANAQRYEEGNNNANNGASSKRRSSSRMTGLGGSPSGVDIPSHSLQGQNQKSAASLLHSTDSSDNLLCQPMANPTQSALAPPRRAPPLTAPPMTSQQQQQRTPVSQVLEYYHRHELNCDSERDHRSGQGHGHDGLLGRNPYGELEHEKLIQSQKSMYQQGQWTRSDGLSGHSVSQGHGHSRPLTRKNNNIVAAILPLITELDLDSLDLVEMALRRKRNECLSPF